MAARREEERGQKRELYAREQAAQWRALKISLEERGRARQEDYEGSRHIDSKISGEWVDKFNQNAKEAHGKHEENRISSEN